MNFIGWIIVACEIAFWIVIILGLVTRYIVKKPKLGFLLLALTPVIDMILLIVTGLDLYNGATATAVHGIAAIYIGVSIAFGKSMIQWADERFQYYVTKQGPKPIKHYGYDYAKQYLKSWFHHVLAYSIGVGLLFALIYIIDHASRTEALMGTFKVWSLVLAIDFIICCSYFIWPRKEKGVN
ncbi:hypothetical protein [Peribacillus asahii]|uniref:hypothetical protein n=1 Tax=Peribacillus asahii TaxID=228899 RepID=UPI00381F91C8